MSDADAMNEVFKCFKEVTVHKNEYLLNCQNPAEVHLNLLKDVRNKYGLKEITQSEELDGVCKMLKWDN